MSCCELSLTDAAGWDQAQADIATTQENWKDNFLWVRLKNQKLFAYPNQQRFVDYPELNVHQQHAGRLCVFRAG